MCTHPLQQMRLIHKVGFTPEEIESYRQLVFGNLLNGMRLILESMPLFELSVEEPNQVRVNSPAYTYDPCSVHPGGR